VHVEYYGQRNTEKGVGLHYKAFPSFQPFASLEIRDLQLKNNLGGVESAKSG